MVLIGACTSSTITAGWFVCPCCVVAAKYPANHVFCSADKLGTNSFNNWICCSVKGLFTTCNTMYATSTILYDIKLLLFQFESRERLVQ